MSGQEPIGQALPAPGWYPDPHGVTRWWDGGAWTETVYAARPYAPAQVAAGTRSGTIWVWLTALLPVIGMIPAILALQQMQGTMVQLLQQASDAPTDARGILGEQMSMYANPWLVAATLAGWIFAAAIILFAFFDRRELAARGFDRPFHWVWAFLGSLVYVIGRAVVVRRRGGSAFAPMWVAIVTQFVSTVVVMVWYLQLVATILQNLPSPAGNP